MDRRVDPGRQTPCLPAGQAASAQSRTPTVRPACKPARPVAGSSPDRRPTTPAVAPAPPRSRPDSAGSYQSSTQDNVSERQSKTKRLRSQEGDDRFWRSGIGSPRELDRAGAGPRGCTFAVLAAGVANPAHGWTACVGRGSHDPACCRTVGPRTTSRPRPALCWRPITDGAAGDTVVHHIRLSPAPVPSLDLSRARADPVRRDRGSKTRVQPQPDVSW